MLKRSVGYMAVLGAALIFCLCGASGASAGAKQDIVAGIKAARAGQQQKAVKLFSRAINSGKLSKENLAIAYTNRGSAYDDLNQADKAVADFNKAVSADPKFAFAYYNRSYAYEKKGLLQLALKDIETANRLEPADADFKDRLKYLRFKLSGAK